MKNFGKITYVDNGDILEQSHHKHMIHGIRKYISGYKNKFEWLQTRTFKFDGRHGIEITFK